MSSAMLIDHSTNTVSLRKHADVLFTLRKTFADGDTVCQNWTLEGVTNRRIKDEHWNVFGEIEAYNAKSECPIEDCILSVRILARY